MLLKCQINANSKKKDFCILQMFKKDIEILILSFEGIVQWDIFFLKKVRSLYLERGAKTNFGLGPFLGLF